MRTALLAPLAGVLLCLAGNAQAQAIGETSCVMLFDGGVSDAGTVACPATFTNLQPFTAVCSLNIAAKGAAAGSINFLASPDGVHYGTIPDGGANIPFIIGDAGASAESVAYAVNIGPPNPWLDIQAVAVGNLSGALGDGGTTEQGYAQCNFGVIQSQTIHAPKAVKHR